MIQIKAMDGSYVLPTCLHKGPVDSVAQPDVCAAGRDGIPPHPWTDEVLAELARKHGDLTCQQWQPANHEFYREMTRRVGCCQILAWEDQRVVGMLPFFPLQVVQLLSNARGQNPPGPEFGVTRPEDAAQSLMVRCVMTAQPHFAGAHSAALTRFAPGNGPDVVTEPSGQKRFRTAQEAGARRGVGQQLVHGLIDWARQNGWKRILTKAHADFDYAYGQYGCGGKAFWQKTGFRVVGSHRMPTPQQEQWRTIVETQAAENGLTADEAWTWYYMVYEM